MGRIDAYSHILPSAVYEEYREISDDTVPSVLEGPLMTDEGIDERLALLDEYDIDRQVLSLTLPRLETERDPESLLSLTRLANDEIRRLADEHDRFVPIATVPFLTGEYVDEVRRCLDDLDMAGVQIDSNVNGTVIDDEAFYPFYEVVDRADVPVWIHPNSTDWHDHGPHEWWMYHMVGWPFDTSMAVTKLLFNGVFEEFGNLRVVAHHLGGMLPFIEERMRRWTAIRENNPGHYDPEEPPRYSGTLDDYLDRVYGDTALFSTGKTPALRTGYEFFGPENVLFGFDFPYAREDVLASTVEAVSDLDVPGEHRERIFADNARELLDL